MFHNSTNEAGPTLATYQQATLKQEDAVLAIFRQRRMPMSPSQVWTHYGASRTPLTSIRRAISDLTEQGLLDRLEVKVEGIYGRSEFLWRLV